MVPPSHIHKAKVGDRVERVPILRLLNEAMASLNTQIAIREIFRREEESSSVDAVRSCLLVLPLGTLPFLSYFEKDGGVM